MKKGSGVGDGKRSGRRCAAATLFETPPRVAASPPSSPNYSPPKSTVLNKSNKRTRKTMTSAAASILCSPAAAASTPAADCLSSIPDLKNLASSRLQDLKLHIDRSHSEILKDCDSAHSRLNKRFKIQSHACQQVLDEADKEYKKMTQRTSESRAAMMASYAEFMADAQASASRACKTTIAEISQSFEKSIESLNSRYGISSK